MGVKISKDKTNVINYLKNKNINSFIIDYFTEYIYQLKNENMCAFAIKDVNQNIVGIETQNGNLEGNGYGFNILNNRNPKYSFYFKNGYELLSFIQKLPQKERMDRLMDSIFISMNGNNIDIIDKMQNVYNTKQIYLCLDESNVEDFTKEVSKNYSFRLLLPKAESWNELLKTRMSINELLDSINSNDLKSYFGLDITEVICKEYTSSIDKYKNIKGPLMELAIGNEAIKLFSDKSEMIENGIKIINNKSDTLIVSDSTINSLSLMTIMDERGKSISQYSYFMMSRVEDYNSINSIVKVLLNENRNLNNVVFAFNNNMKNKDIVERLSKELVVNVIKYFPREHTFNEELIIRRGKNVNKRYRGINERTQEVHDGSLQGDREFREKYSTNGRIFSGSNEVYEEKYGSEIQGVDSKRRIGRKVGEEEQRGRNFNVADNRSSRGKGRSEKDSRNFGKNKDSEANISRSESTSNERYSTETNLDFRNKKNINYGGAKQKYKNNVLAITLLKELEDKDRYATYDEQEVLSMYTGWGGISQVFDKRNDKWKKEYEELKDLLTEDEYKKARASTPNAHYTDPIVIDGMYKFVEKNFKNKNINILEPAMGTGNFFANLPSNINGNLYGIELDDVSGRIAKKLFPSAKIEINGFEKTKLENSFDLIIGNIPFGNYQIYDSQYDEKYLIHDYFFIKSIDKLKAGGILAFITSKGTLDKSSNTVRKYLAQRAELLGAIRLPNTTFKNIANTEVTTDIIFLQKRDRPIVCEPDWIHIGANSDGVPMNQYFIENPEMLLGKMIFNKSMYGNSKDTALVQSKDFNLEKSLNDAISKIRAFDIKLKESKILESKNNYIVADPTVKNFSYTIVDSELYYRKNDFMYKSPLKGKKLEKAKQLHFIRNKIREVINIQLIDDYDISLLKEKQKELNDLYDKFVDSYGFINDNANKYIFKDDDDVFLLRNLEVIVDNGYEKSDIFSKETVMPKQSYKIEIAQDALVLSLNNHGKVDLDYMCKVYSKDKNTIINELDGMIFLNPVTSEYEARDMYLSGNVKEKLNIAKSAGYKYEKNVKELELVQPKPIEIDKIGFRLGTNWITTDIYIEFIYELLETPDVYKLGNVSNSIGLKYDKLDVVYSISGSSIHKSFLVDSKYGTKRMNAYKIIEHTLNQRIVEVNDYIKVEGRKTPKSVLNFEETQIARSKQEIIKSRFKSWILRKKSKEVENFYNENLNVYVPRKFSGDIILPAMNPEIELRSHQKEAAMRILLGNSNCLIAHEVGSGKTYSLAVGAMLLKRARVAKKPLFVVPNHLLNQWGSEFITLFPTANILVPTEKDFQTSNRKQFITKISFGEYDAVFLTFSQFGKIKMSNEFLREQIKADIDEVVDAMNDIEDDLGVKHYEIIKKSLEAKLEEQIEKTNKNKDTILNFDELGIDYLFVDEAHEYKNCFVHTKMRNIGGVSTSNAQKSYDMLMKVRYINNKNNGRGVVFATGTPVTNSISELFVMQRYLQYDDLKKIGIGHFDQWAGCFGDITTTSEIDVTGDKYVTKTRFSKFYNMPELLKLLNQVVDFKTADELNIARPNFFKGKPETISIEASDFANHKMKEFEDRADKIRSGNVDPSLDNMLKITTEGRGLAIDPKLIDESYTNKDSKVYVCVKNVVDIYNEYEKDKALQLIFLDYGISLYKNIKDEMIKLGIKANEIALIGDANTKEKKEIMFSKCRTGEIRVLIGSTKKMGTGTNVQNRMIALHHLDCPWKPSELEQRNGRIRRQGNIYNEVKVYQYITKGTFDAYMWQVQEKKQTFISQLMKNDLITREYEDIDDRALEYSEVKALCLGDPRLKEKADVDNAIQRLQIEKSEYFKEQNRLKGLAIEIPKKIKKIENSINTLKKDIMNFNDKNEFKLKQEFTNNDRSESQMLFDIMINIPSNSSIEVGKYDKFNVIIEKSYFSFAVARLDSKYTNIEIELGENPVGNLMRIKNFKKMYAKKLDYLINRKKELDTDFKYAKENCGIPFYKEEELSIKLERQVKLTFELENEKVYSEGIKNNQEKIM